MLRSACSKTRPSVRASVLSSSRYLHVTGTTATIMVRISKAGPFCGCCCIGVRHLFLRSLQRSSTPATYRVYQTEMHHRTTTAASFGNRVILVKDRFFSIYRLQWLLLCSYRPVVRAPRSVAASSQGYGNMGCLLSTISAG